MVVAVDELGVGHFKRIHKGEALSEGEMLMQYRVRKGRVRFATNAFFFQEGRAQLFEAAEYGEFRVDASGELLLTGMRDKDLSLIGQDIP